MQNYNKKLFSNLIKFFIIYISIFFFTNKLVFAGETKISSTKFNEKITGQKLDQDPSSYILDAGDYIEIILEDLPEYSGTFAIGPDGYLYLPQIKSIKAAGYSLNELEKSLLIKYKEQIINPNLFMRIVVYRPVRVYIHGEVTRPGFYTISNPMSLYDSDVDISRNYRLNETILSIESTFNIDKPNINSRVNTISNLNFPTLYDSLRASQGVTPFSDLSQIVVTRKMNHANGTKIQTTLNLLSLFKNGDQSQNIRILDKDTIEVKKSSDLITEQLNLARKSNINPDNLIVFLGGKVLKPGQIIVPKGSGLNQAIELGGGKQLLTGRVEFLRFQSDGLTDKRIFSYNKNARLDSYKNPILMKGDIINIKDSLFRKSTVVVKTVTGPFVGVYSVMQLFGFD